MGFPGSGGSSPELLGGGRFAPGPPTQDGKPGALALLVPVARPSSPTKLHDSNVAAADGEVKEALPPLDTMMSQDDDFNESKGTATL
jgi:hypothetical protein